MKTYLVTGGAGFIGSNFILYLLRTYKDVRVVNLDSLTYAGNLENLKSVENDPRYNFEHVDIRSTPEVTRVLNTWDPDYVVNFAAESHVDRSIENPGIFVDTNVMGCVNLLNCCRAAWGESALEHKRFLQVSTDEVYGALALPKERLDNGSPKDPAQAGYFHEDTPLQPHSPYSASKASADMLTRAYYDTYHFPALVTRCSNNYGPYQFPEKLIPLMIHNALHHKELPIYGDGQNVRDWLYVDDHCAAIALVLEKGRLGEAYNVGGHNERSNIYIVKTIIQTLARLTGDAAITPDLIRFVSDRKGHDRRYGIEPLKIHQELGWQPSTSFELGIEQTISWYLDHEDWVDRICEGSYQDYYKKMYGNRLS